MDNIVGLGNRITYDFVAPGVTKSHTSLDNIVSLGNRITYDFVAPGATKSHTSLDNIVSLGNRITYEIVYDFRRDRTTVELCSCRKSWDNENRIRLHNTTAKSKMHGETNLMITYDVTCQKLPRLA